MIILNYCPINREKTDNETAEACLDLRPTCKHKSLIRELSAAIRSSQINTAAAPDTDRTRTGHTGQTLPGKHHQHQQLESVFHGSEMT